MAVTLQRVEGQDLPDSYRIRGIEVAFKVTDAGGNLDYLETEEEAAALVAKLHRDDVGHPGGN